jgi:septal ring factor EnvC (AmiA/AmiB activator)
MSEKVTFGFVDVVAFFKQHIPTVIISLTMAFIGHSLQSSDKKLLRQQQNQEEIQKDREELKALMYELKKDIAVIKEHIAEKDKHIQRLEEVDREIKNIQNDHSIQIGNILMMK